MKLPIDDPIIAALKDLTVALDDLGMRAVLIGGVAVSLVAQPRFTRDVDALIILDTAELSRFVDMVQRHQFAPLFQDMIQFAEANRIAPLRHIPTGITVDIALGCMPFEIEMIQRAQQSPDADIGLLIPMPEDLIILKAIAGRPKDLEDIRNIAVIYPNMDRKRIEYWVRQYSELLGTPDLWDEIELLLRG